MITAKQSCAGFLILALFAVFMGCASSGEKIGVAPQVEDVQTESQAKTTDYIVGIGDVVDILVYRHDDVKTSAKINPSGKIMLPLIGDVQVAGRSLAAVREELTQRFSHYFVDPQISIQVSNIQSQKIVVVGEVKNPGVFYLDSDLSIMDAVARAGGWTPDAQTSSILLFRTVSGKVESRMIDMEEAFKTGKLAGMEPLQKSDIVYVPTKKIANISRFMNYISNILSPFVMLEGGIVLGPQVVDALQGESTGSVAIPTR